VRFPIFIVLFTVIRSFTAIATNEGIIDSIKEVISTAKHDTIVCYAYLHWGEKVYLKNPDTAAILFESVRRIAEDNLPELVDRLNASNTNNRVNKKYLSLLADAVNNIGTIAHSQGNITMALEYYLEAMEIDKELGDKEGVAGSLSNIGYIYKSQGDIEKALEYNHKSLLKPNLRNALQDEPL